MPPTVDCCKTCKFFILKIPATGEGLCAKSAPVTIVQNGTETRQDHALVDPGEWCGDYVKKT